MKYLLNSEKAEFDPEFEKLMSELISANNHVTELEIEGLSNDLIERLPFKHFNRLEDVKVFEGNINVFFKNSQHFASLKSLTVLQINKNNVASDDNQIIADEIKHINTLVNLYICSNRITRISDSLCQLENIESLTLSTKAMLPEELCLLPKLRSFRFEMMDNQMEEKNALDVISKLGRLDSFSYTNPFSTRVPDFQDNLLNLENFAFSMLNVSGLPAVLPRMTRLKYLHLSNNLQTIPEWFVNLKKLEYLTIEGLADGCIPLFMKELPNLHTINLMGCLDVRLDDSRIEQIKNDFPELKILGVNEDY